MATSAGLTCWETEDYNAGRADNPYMNKRDMTKVISERECASDDKSCLSKGYNVGGGKMQCEL